jgi:pfkB family carbohydrate kinase
MIYNDPQSLAPVIAAFKAGSPPPGRLSGLCGFDGFIDTFIRMEVPDTMAEFGPKVAAAAGIAASYTVRHEGDKFGGNGPLFASGLHGLWGGNIDVTYIGAMGRDEVLPIYREALEAKTKRLVTLAEPAHSDCLEFRDGKIMLCDLRSCAEITLERLLERAGSLDAELRDARFIAAVNWGKLVNVGEIWSHLAARLAALGRSAKDVLFFMDLAEFEHRPAADVVGLLDRLAPITRQCRTVLSFNLKEGWQMAAHLGGDFHGKKQPEAVLDLARFLRARIAVDRIIVHPNDGAAAADENDAVYVPAPFCREPLISTGAGDNFGAGCLSGMLLGLDLAGTLLAGNSSSGFFVRAGRTGSFAELAALAEAWAAGSLPERL